MNLNSNLNSSINYIKFEKLVNQRKALDSSQTGYYYWVIYVLLAFYPLPLKAYSKENLVFFYCESFNWLFKNSYLISSYHLYIFLFI